MSRDVTCWQRGWQIARAAAAAALEERDAALRELEWTRGQLVELREALAELRAAVTARWQAEARIADLYREREIARASAVERDPSAMLN
jgi:hypothetical protein